MRHSDSNYTPVDLPTARVRPTCIFGVLFRHFVTDTLGVVWSARHTTTLSQHGDPTPFPHRTTIFGIWLIRFANASQSKFWNLGLDIRHWSSLQLLLVTAS